MTNHVTWMAAMSMLSAAQSGRGAAGEELANDLAAAASEGPYLGSWPRLEDKSGLHVGQYLVALIMVLSRGKGLSPAAESFIASANSLRGRALSIKPVLATTAAIRIFQMCALADAKGEWMWKPSAVFPERLQLFASLLDRHFVKRFDATMIAAQQAWTKENANLRTLRTGLQRLVPEKEKGKEKPKSSSAFASYEREIFHARFDMYDWQHPRALPPKGRIGTQWSMPWATLRGTSPELLPTMVAALRERLAGFDERKRVFALLRKCSPAWPADFSFEGPGAERRMSDTMISSVTHYADRFAAIPALFNGAPVGSAAARVAQLYDAYSTLVASVTTGAAPMARAPARRVASKAKKPARKK